MATQTINRNSNNTSTSRGQTPTFVISRKAVAWAQTHGFQALITDIQNFINTYRVEAQPTTNMTNYFVGMPATKLAQAEARALRTLKRIQQAQRQTR